MNHRYSSRPHHPWKSPGASLVLSVGKVMFREISNGERGSMLARNLTGQYMCCSHLIRHVYFLWEDWFDVFFCGPGFTIFGILHQMLLALLTSWLQYVSDLNVETKPQKESALLSHSSIILFIDAWYMTVWAPQFNKLVNIRIIWVLLLVALCTVCTWWWEGIPHSRHVNDYREDMQISTQNKVQFMF